MTGGIYRAVTVAHPPRMGIPERAPDFIKPLIQASLDLGKDILAEKPDVMIVQSTHYVSTFNWHATTQARHKGYCVAQEAPDLIGGEFYDYKGDPELAQRMRALIVEAKLPCVENATEHFSWDYGTWVPVHYMDPEAKIPVINVPVVLAADLDECYRIGELIHQACKDTGRRGVFVASTSLSHKLVRGPEQWPTPERLEADHKFIKLLMDGKIDEAWAGFKEYAEFTVGEMGGRVVATMLGALAASGAKRFDTAQFGPYGQSSGSGNVTLSLKPAA
jgi:3,4-dihydroxyphenylacetate 2,3-dioxygenase